MGAITADIDIVTQDAAKMDITVLLNPGAEAQTDLAMVQANTAEESSEADADIFLTELAGTDELLIGIPADKEAATVPPGAIKYEATQDNEQIAEVLERWSGISAAVAEAGPTLTPAEIETTAAQEADSDVGFPPPALSSAHEFQKAQPIAERGRHESTGPASPHFFAKPDRIEGIAHPRQADAGEDLPPRMLSDISQTRIVGQSVPPVEPLTISQAVAAGNSSFGKIGDASFPGVTGTEQEGITAPRPKAGTGHADLPVVPASVEAHSEQPQAATVSQPVTQTAFEPNDISLPVRTQSVADATTGIAPANSFRSASLPPPAVARQITDIVVTTRNEIVEITLIPEELGRIRMILTGQERAPHLTVWVERPEVLEQMRRQGNDLLQEFRKEGMADATLDFRDGRQMLSDGHNDDSAWNGADGGEEDSSSSLTTGPVTDTYRTKAGMPGIDIRV